MNAICGEVLFSSNRIRTLRSTWSRSVCWTLRSTTAPASSVLAALILDAESAVTAPYTVPPSAPNMPPAAATPSPTPAATQIRAPNPRAPPHASITPPVKESPGETPATSPDPAPLSAPIPFPLVVSRTSGENEALGTPTVLSSARISSELPCGARA